jgi:hypothetical protein
MDDAFKRSSERNNEVQKLFSAYDTCFDDQSSVAVER